MIDYNSMTRATRGRVTAALAVELGIPVEQTTAIIQAAIEKREQTIEYAIEALEQLENAVEDRFGAKDCAIFRQRVTNAVSIYLARLQLSHTIK